MVAPGDVDRIMGFPFATTQEATKAWEEKESADEKWRHDCSAYLQAVHDTLSYKQAAAEFMQKQQHEPQGTLNRIIIHEGKSPTLVSFSAYRGKIVRLESTDPEIVFLDEDGEIFVTDDKGILLIKHQVLRKERYFRRVQREVEALENMERLEGASREPIPESVRLFVWQRDKGQCVKCGEREKLEFDHIIPVASGGGNTERNVQLLCESCNRSKGATI